MKAASTALALFDGPSDDWFQWRNGKTPPAPRRRRLFDLHRQRQSLQCGPMELSERQRKYLRGLGHALNPVLLIGNAGVSPAVIAEAARALNDHELIKVKFRGAERAA